MATIEDTVHRVIAHNVDKNKPIDLTCNESSNEILTSSYNELDANAVTGANKDPLSSTKDHKGPLETTCIGQPLNNTKDKKHEITRILSGYKQILPSRPPPVLPFRSNTSVQRKILPNLQKSLLLPGSHNSLPYPPILTSPMLQPLFAPQRRKAEPLSPGIPGLPKPKKQRKMSTINEEVEKPSEDHNESAFSSNRKNKLPTPKKEKCKEKSNNVCSKQDKKRSSSNSTEKIVKKAEEPKVNNNSIQDNTLNVKFIITSDDGLKLESDSYKGQ